MNILNQLVVTGFRDFLSITHNKTGFQTIERAPAGLIFSIDGKATFRKDGKAYVLDKDHVILLPPECTYKLHIDKKGTFLLSNFYAVNYPAKHMLLLPVKNLSLHISDFKQMKNLFIFENNNAKILSIFYGMLSRLSEKSKPHISVLRPALDFIETNYKDTAITNKSLAELCGISEAHFRNLFKNEFHTSPHQYILDIKIQKAKQLLTDGNDKIGEISEKSGFQNQYHFSRIFKQKTGITPMEYKKQNKYL